jgi:hypothetical protein
VLTRTRRRGLMALAAVGIMLLSVFSLAPAQATTGSTGERASGKRVCTGLALASDAGRATPQALQRLREQALASPEVQMLRQYLSGHGYVAMDARAGGTVSSRDSVVLLPMAKQGDRQQRGAAIAYAVHADGTTTVEAATLSMNGRTVKTERQYKVNGTQVVRTHSFISCMVACLSVRCTAIVRCPTIFGPGAFLACATAVCGSRVPGCVRLCR